MKKIWKLEKPLKEADKALKKLDGASLIKKMKKMGQK